MCYDRGARPLLWGLDCGNMIVDVVSHAYLCVEAGRAMPDRRPHPAGVDTDGSGHPQC